MSLPLLVIRPEPGCSSTVAAARAKDLDAHGFPLFTVRAMNWQASDPSTYDALLIGSANALCHAGPELGRLTGKPAYVVGDATARAARDAGLKVVATGDGGLQNALSRLRPEHRRLLRLAGREHIDLVAPTGVTIEERVVYASEALPMPDLLARQLSAPVVILLHSAAAARHFGAECGRLGLDRAHLTLATIGPRVAAAATDGWLRVACAESPDDAALLALASDLCHTP